MDLRITVVEDESIPDGLEPPELREYIMNIRDLCVRSICDILRYSR